MNEETRSTSHGDGTWKSVKPENYCDQKGQSNQSPGWKGAGWYRMQAPAGLVIPEASPGKYHCGTNCAGWLRGTHPDTPGTTLDNAVFCFDCKQGKQWSECEFSSFGKVTNCGDFYVYYLKDTPKCYLRYCANF